MYKIICRDLGFDCDYIMKKINKTTIIDTLSRHLMTSHDTYYPKKEISGFIDKQNNLEHENDLELNREFDALHAKKEFAFRKNFP